MGGQELNARPAADTAVALSARTAAVVKQVAGGSLAAARVRAGGALHERVPAGAAVRSTRRHVCASRRAQEGGGDQHHGEATHPHPERVGAEGLDDMPQGKSDSAGKTFFESKS